MHFLLTSPDRRVLALRLLGCFAAGFLSSFAMAPYDAWLCLFIGLGFLYVLLPAATTRQAFFYAGLFALGYFAFGLSWIANALKVEGNPYQWVWPLAIFVVPLPLSLFAALAAYLAKKFCDLSRVPGFFAFAAFLSLAEWLRGFFFAWFPWNLFGYAWAGIPQIVQSVSLANIYFLTLLTILWAALPGFLFIAKIPRRQKIILALVLCFIFGAGFLYGSIRLDRAPDAQVENVYLKLVQANIPQAEKWKSEKMWDHFLKHIDMSQPASPQEEAAGRTTYIVWPETALSYGLLQDRGAIDAVKEMLDRYHGPAYLITGLLRFDPSTENYFNSVVMIDRQGRISNVYDKQRLVPFGEYIPFQKWIPLKTVTDFSGFGFGRGPVTFAVPEGLKYSPVICYEIIFSGGLTGPERPDFIVNVTNDSWYGLSAGPHQHFTQALFRAVEEGVPVVRVAGTGISAVIDAYGRAYAQSGLFETYQETLALPQKSVRAPLSAVLKNAAFLALLAVFITAGVAARRRQPLNCK